MKNVIKLISLLLCICMLFSACKPQSEAPDESTTTPEHSTTENNVDTEESFSKSDGKISLPYNESDGLNPFFAKSDENLYICKLLFEPLFAVDSNYSSNGVIAESISVKGKTATVKIKHGISCRGSSNINADDVVYSFNLAKASYGWADDLKGVSAAIKANDYAVNFTLDYADSLVAGKLTFPVVKAGTADVETAVPTGSGDYYHLEGRLISLANNDKHIYLCPVSTRDSVENALKIGACDVFFSNMSDCNYTGASGNTQSVLLNNMVYLGLNSSRGALNKYIRSAIAAKIDCEEIALSAYQGHAAASKLPVNPESAVSEEIIQIATKGDKVLADNIIDRCGYTRYSGKAKTNGAYLLSFTLIVNKDNKYRVAAAYNIADSLAECGFYINVQALSFADYKERITSGNYDMYLGEIKLDSSMDLSAFFLEDGTLSSGVNKTDRAVTEYYNYRAGKITAEEYYKIFAEEYPFVPVLFRAGYVISSDDIKLDLTQMPNNLYSGL